MHSQVTAQEYESWPEEQCAGIEIVGGMVVVSPSASRRHNRLARVLANALGAIDFTPTRPEYVLLAAGSFSPGSDTTDRVVKLTQYASADIPLYWRAELTPTRIPRRLHLPARFREQALPGRRRAHRARHRHRALRGRG